MTLKPDNYASTAELDAALSIILAAPTDTSRVELLCFRPDFEERRFCSHITLSPEHGIEGERWAKAPWIKLDSGAPDPRIQVCIISKRVLDVVWRDRDSVIHPGDTFVCDMNFSEENMPAGQLLAVGEVVLQVSDLFNDACIKWLARYGRPSYDWINAEENRKLRLRGVLCKIVKGGTLHLNDEVRKLSPPE